VDKSRRAQGRLVPSSRARSAVCKDASQLIIVVTAPMAFPLIIGIQRAHAAGVF